MDNLGRLRVNEFLQVDGYTDIFALGDCCDTEEPKLGYVAGLHGTWLGSQLKDYFDGRKIKPYAVGKSRAISFILKSSNSSLQNLC